MKAKIVRNYVLKKNLQAQKELLVEKKNFPISTKLAAVLPMEKEIMQMQADQDRFDKKMAD